jgi:DNA-binding IclR family transcriptional regulator
VGRKRSEEQLEEIYDAIEQNPGWLPAWIARLLGRQRSDITRALPSLDEHGFLVSEDEEGRLWPFRRSPGRED